MAQQNLISVNISEADQKDIGDAIATLKAKLMPHLKTMSAQDRLELTKLGDKSFAFGQKSIEYGQHYPELAPPYLDLAELAADMKGMLLLRGYSQDLAPVISALDDSVMQAGSDIYQGALMLYNSFQYAAKANVPNAATIYEDLATRFPGRGPALKKKV